MSFSDALVHLPYWFAFGALLGFWHGWRRTRVSFDRAMAHLDTLGATAEWRRAALYVYGLRLGALLVSAVAGTIIGGAIWSVLSLFASLLSWFWPGLAPFPRA